MMPSGSLLNVLYSIKHNVQSLLIKYYVYAYSNAILMSPYILRLIFFLVICSKCMCIVKCILCCKQQTKEKINVGGMTNISKQNLIRRLMFAFENIIYFCVYIFVIVVVNHRFLLQSNNHKVMSPSLTKFLVIKLYSHWSRVAIIS
jgi:hypothetical protein